MVVWAVITVALSWALTFAVFQWHEQVFVAKLARRELFNEVVQRGSHCRRHAAVFEESARERRDLSLEDIRDIGDALRFCVSPMA
jgi:hypothetical protein